MTTILIGIAIIVVASLSLLLARPLLRRGHRSLLQAEIRKARAEADWYRRSSEQEQDVSTSQFLQTASIMSRRRVFALRARLKELE